MYLRKFFWLFYLLLIGCASSPPAPVIDRTPAEKKPVATKPAGSLPVDPEKDWRPDFHTVKKGDTLYGIGLQYGFDYKDIAQANNIPPPYPIHIGQQLSFQALKANGKVTATTATSTPAEEGVVVSPFRIDSTPIDASKLPPPQPEAPVLAEPKALREPFSELALATPPTVTKTEKQVEQNKVQETVKPAESAPQPGTVNTGEIATEEDAVDWAWPANGKILAGFNGNTNTRGIDIGGSLGQPVSAAAAGKVIYSGSDLRGYGKLVIIKHNKTYLSVYAHNSQILVKEGQQVTKGQKIAEMGSTDADRVKLHFEIRKQGKSVDPAKYLASNP